MQNDLNIHGIPTTVARLSSRLPISPCTHIKQDSQRPAAFALHIAMPLSHFHPLFQDAVRSPDHQLV